ncbi:hypothetical protein J6590_047355 [Homalodisca vitripennis]|nr:hypothetical protein J6590_047355 [Homalodisca vitripennis]
MITTQNTQHRSLNRATFTAQPYSQSQGYHLPDLAQHLRIPVLVKDCLYFRQSEMADTHLRFARNKLPRSKSWIWAYRQMEMHDKATLKLHPGHSESPAGDVRDQGRLLELPKTSPESLIEWTAQVHTPELYGDLLATLSYGSQLGPWLTFYIRVVITPPPPNKLCSLYPALADCPCITSALKTSSCKISAKLDFVIPY